MKKCVMILMFLVFVFCFLVSESFGSFLYLGWIYNGSGEKPASFPKTEETHSITEVVCTSSSARWDYNKKKVVISPSSNINGCNVVVSDKQDSPAPSTDSYEEIKEDLDNEIDSCETQKTEQENYKNLIVNAIVSASGEIDTSDESILNYQYLGNFISKSLYVYATSYSRQESANLQQKSTSGTTKFPVPFKTDLKVTKSSVTNRYSGMNCTGGVKTVDRFGYTWTLSNSSNRNGTCYLDVTFTQP